METLQETVAHLPHTPGVYLFYDKKRTILYIGKAKDLKKRVTQYFHRDDAVGPKTQKLVSQITSIETHETASELDALLLEAKLIHDHTPKYNVVLKDDKSPLYILLTFSEPLPHVLTMRKSDLPKKIKKRDALFGPFQSAQTVRNLLRVLRHIVPYCTQKKRTGKACFYFHLGLCNPCPSDARTDKRAYRKNIYQLHRILSGRAQEVIHELENQMKVYSRADNFEQAAIARNHIQNLHKMLAKKYDPMLYISGDIAVDDIYTEELRQLGKALGISALHRIECFDISNTIGKNATGSMVVLIDGKKDTSQYKRFKIKFGETPNDFAMMKEVIIRRLRHPEWGVPDLIVIDGGKGQISAVKEVIHTIPVIGLAKRFEEIIIPRPDDTWKVIRLDLTSPALLVLQRIRDEAHRFALSYHRLLRKKSFGTMRSQ